MNVPIRGEEPADFAVYSDFMVRQSPIGYTWKPQYKQQHKLTNGLYTDAQSGFQMVKTSTYRVETMPLLRCLPLTELYKYCLYGLLLLQHIWSDH